jgi:DNA polymerase-1
MTVKPMLLLFDADILVFQATSSVETEIRWSEDCHTLSSNPKEAQEIFKEKLENILGKIQKKYPGEHRIIMCFSDKENFRKQVYPLYKSNRKDKRKPLCHSFVRQWVMDTWESKVLPTLEADDLLGILATSLQDTLIISADKDLKTIPGKLYSPDRDEFYEITEEEAEYNHLYQTLNGDRIDGYPGCPGVGDKTARKILDKDCSWEAVVRTYESKGLTESEALVQARVAKILTSHQYDLKNRKVLLWNPKTQKSE